MQTQKLYNLLYKSYPKDYQIKIVDSLEYLQKIFNDDRILAIDFETCGTNIEDPNHYPVGIGVSNSTLSAYLICTKYNTKQICDWLLTKSITCFNATFDAGWLYRYTGQMPNIIFDSFGAFFHLGSEGYAGQKHDLKTAMVDLLGWEESNTHELDEWLKQNKLKKADMWKAPTEILGTYCAMDAIATFHLYEYFQQIIKEKKLHGYSWYHTNLYITTIKLVIEQQMKGIMVDAPQLQHYLNKLGKQISNRAEGFLHHEEVEEHIQIYNELCVAEYLKREPPKTNKGGRTSARWEAWNAKLGEVTSTQYFNINSKKQLQWLFYTQLKLPIPQRTKKGAGAVNKKILHLLGSAGKVLKQYNELVKEQGYVQKCTEMLKDSVLHVKFRVPGTVTGRMAGSGGFNLSQQPKKRGYLECLKARDSNKLIQLDLSSLEPRVCCQFSKDKSMMKLYGPGAKENCIYLFNAAHIAFSSVQVRQWYDPENPTKESIKDAKEHCKPIRQLIKVCTLAMQYGAQPRKLVETVNLQGFNINYSDAENIYNDYWELYSGIKQFETVLKRQYLKNNGWLMNGAGRPIAIDGGYLKDILNRYVQATGHDVLMFLITIINKLRLEEGLNITPWLVDFHDETIWECKEEDADKAKKLFEKALVILNESLKWEIKMTGEVTINNNLADIKCEE